MPAKMTSRGPLTQLLRVVRRGSGHGAALRSVPRAVLPARRLGRGHWPVWVSNSRRVLRDRFRKTGRGGKDRKRTQEEETEKTKTGKFGI